jgi:hypothetical protein
MDPAETVSQILQSAPGEGICDACLAFAVEEALVTIQALTKRLAMSPSEYLRDVGHCENCGRVTETTTFVQSATDKVEARDRLRKCVRCSRRVNNDEEEVVNGDLFHRQCWTVLRSEAQIADSRQMAKLTQQLIRNSRARLDGESNGMK